MSSNKQDIPVLIEYLRQLSAPGSPGDQAADALETLRSQLAAVVLERDAAVKDTERLDWFERVRPIAVIGEPTKRCSITTTEDGLKTYSGPTLRTAIDTAMPERDALKANAYPGSGSGEVSTPSPGLLVSMAIRFDHGLGVPGFYDAPIIGHPGDHQKRLESTMRTMRQLWEEVTGNGSYSPERESFYAAHVAQASEGSGESSTGEKS